MHMFSKESNYEQNDGIDSIGHRIRNNKFIKTETFLLNLSLVALIELIKSKFKLKTPFRNKWNYIIF